MEKKNYKDFLRALGYRESGGRYNIENSYGYLGKYQMGESALKDAGYYRGD
ncbi:MAG: LysM domain-containing protein, partial [Persephonella sp.]